MIIASADQSAAIGRCGMVRGMPCGWAASLHMTLTSPTSNCRYGVGDALRSAACPLRVCSIESARIRIDSCDA